VPGWHASHALAPAAEAAVPSGQAEQADGELE
jgi:hypothetical protein